VTEIFRALEFEKKYSKQEILEMYLNTIFPGKECYGVQTASQYYFGKDVSELDTGGVRGSGGHHQQPVPVYNPLISDKTRANNKKPAGEILKQMWKQGYIDEHLSTAAVSETLNFTDGSKTPAELVAEANGASTPASVDQPVQFLFCGSGHPGRGQRYGGEAGTSPRRPPTIAFTTAATKLYTTVDPTSRILRSPSMRIAANLDVTSKSGQQLQSGITIVDVTSGNVVAMVGGRRTKEGDMVWNYATDVQQCGSSIKPI
jgi:penicillin-binding protein 1A